MSVVGRSHWFDRSRPTSALPRSTDAHETGPVVQFMPQPDSCTAANWNARQQRGGGSKNSSWGQLGPPARTIRGLPTLQCQGTVIDPGSLLGCSADAAPTDQ